MSRGDEDRRARRHRRLLIGRGEPRFDARDLIGTTRTERAIALERLSRKRERANPREVVGRQALFVVNLAPRRMAGEVSEGMLFDIGYADGITPVLATPEAPVPDGARAG